MRVIKSDSGFLAYQKIFKQMLASASRLVVWQLRPGSGGRVIAGSFLNSFQLEKKLLHFDKSSFEGLDQNLPLFCYSEDGLFIFKTSITEIRDKVFSAAVPEEIKLLEDLDVTFIKGSCGVDLATVLKVKRIKVDDERQSDYLKIKSMRDRSSRDQEFLNNEFGAKSLDEEDKLFADKRESPRARPKQDKHVKVMGENSDEVHTFRLFDLSRGGIGFLCVDPSLFPKGSQIRVVGFEDFDLDDPLLGRVMSHRPVDESEVEFKIGCKFDEGQE